MDVDIPGLSLDGHSYSGIRRYSDVEREVDVPGLSMDGHSYSQLSTKQLCHPWMAVDCLRHHWTYLEGKLYTFKYNIQTMPTQTHKRDHTSFDCYNILPALKQEVRFNAQEFHLALVFSLMSKADAQ